MQTCINYMLYCKDLPTNLQKECTLNEQLRVHRANELHQVQDLDLPSPNRFDHKQNDHIKIV